MDLELTCFDALADYPAFAEQARGLGADIRTAYTDALDRVESEERVRDRYCEAPVWFPGHCQHLTTVVVPTVLQRAKEFVELDEQIQVSSSSLEFICNKNANSSTYSQNSTGLLKDLSSFLSTFQSDLSAVSGHISELQGRSRTIEQRLELRKVRTASGSQESRCRLMFIYRTGGGAILASLPRLDHNLASSHQIYH